MNFEALQSLSIVRGANGAGKTSLFQALVWVLTGNSETDTEDVIQSGKKYCEVKLAVEYQNKLISIARSRGSRFDFVVTVDGRTVEASSKTDLQKKLEEILPIITKLHLLYYNQSRDGLLSELSDSDRVGLISELTGLNLIAELSSDAEQKVTELKEKATATIQEYDKLFSMLTGLKSTYQDNLTDPSDEIAKSESTLSNIEQAKWAYSKEKESIADSYKDLYRNKYKVRNAIEDTLQEEFNKKQQALRTKMSQLADKAKEIQLKIKEIDGQIRAQENITKKKTEWVCDKCGTLIKAKNLTQEDIANTQQKIDNLVSEKAAHKEKISELENLIERVNAKQSDDQHKLGCEIEKTAAQVDQEIRELERKESDERNAITVKLNALLGDEKVARDNHVKLLQQQSLYERNLEIKNKIEKLAKKVKLADTVKIDASAKYDAYKKVYKKVFGDSGLLAATVLEKLATVVNNDENIKIVTTKILKNGNLKPTLEMEMRINNAWLKYRQLSGGERLYADLYLLQKIIDVIGGNVSFLLCDEVLKYADAESSKKMIGILKNMKVRNCFLIFHGTVSDDLLEYSAITQIGVTKVAGNSVYDIA